MDEKDPRLIMTLEAVSPTAERAWNRPQNQDRCLPASESVADISSRESTPAVGQTASQIQLTFDDKPKNLEKGFVFGSDPRICDVFLGERGAGFSGQQFCITFNERGEVIFKNKSRKEAQVNYNGENPSPRNQFTWILFDTYKNIKITMGEEDDLIFKVKWPENRKYCPAEYEAHRDAYFEERRNAFPPLSQLDMETQQPTAMPTAQHSPRQKSPGQESPRQKSPGQKSPRQKPPGQEPIYLLEEELGYGGFGTVYKAVDVSTGDVHAAKKFHHGDWKKEVDILMSLSHVSVIINLMIGPCLTFRKGAYREIREVLGGAETSAGDGISASWKLSLPRFHHRRRDPPNSFSRTSGSRLPPFPLSASGASRHQAGKHSRSVSNALRYQARRLRIGQERFFLKNLLRIK